MKGVSLLLPLMFASGVSAQDKASTPSTHVQACVIVKRHTYKFGENASRLHPHRPFDYVEGDYPANFRWRSELGDGNVRELEQKGGKMLVLRPDYQPSDLEDARKQCKAAISPPVTHPGTN